MEFDMDLQLEEFNEGEKSYDTEAVSDMQDEELDGITFTIPEGFALRDCFIQKHALYKLADSAFTFNLRSVFHRNERLIHQIARRIIGKFRVNETVIITAADIVTRGKYWRELL